MYIPESNGRCKIPLLSLVKTAKYYSNNHSILILLNLSYDQYNNLQKSQQDFFCISICISITDRIAELYQYQCFAIIVKRTPSPPYYKKENADYCILFFLRFLYLISYSRQHFYIKSTGQKNQMIWLHNLYVQQNTPDIKDFFYNKMFEIT